MKLWSQKGEEGAKAPPSSKIKPKKKKIAQKKIKKGRSSKVGITKEPSLGLVDLGQVPPQPKKLPRKHHKDSGEVVREEKEEEAEPPARGFYEPFFRTFKCEQLCYSLGLSYSNIRKLKRQFDENDMYHTGEITQAELFYMIQEEPRPITRGIFTFGDVDAHAKLITFDQYVRCITSFAVLTKPELFEYVFNLYDADLSGSLDENEFIKMSTELQSSQFSFPKNVETAIAMLQGKSHDGSPAKRKLRRHTSDGLVDLSEFMQFARHFPAAFYPIINMQKNVRSSTLGERCWSKIVERKMKIQEVTKFIRRSGGELPPLTMWQRFCGLFDNSLFIIRKRAAEKYAAELQERKKLGWHKEEE